MNVTTEQQVRGTLAPLTAGGNPAPVQNPRWEIDEPPTGPLFALTVEPTNPLICDFRGLTLPDGVTPLTVQVRCRFDADLGEGVRELLAIGELTLVPAEAVIGNVAFGTPTPAEPPPAPEPAPAPEPTPGS